MEIITSCTPNWDLKEERKLFFRSSLQSVRLPLSHRIKAVMVCLSGTSSCKWASGQSAACRADTTAQLWSHALFTAESEVTAGRVCADDTVTFSSPAASSLKSRTLCCSYCSFIHTGYLSHLRAVSRASYTGVCPSFTFHQNQVLDFIGNFNEINAVHFYVVKHLILCCFLITGGYRSDYTTRGNFGQENR